MNQKPFVTIIWLNYNGGKIIDIVKKSLDALASIDYPNYEVIVIDNNSTDNSGEIIRQYICDEKFKNFQFIKTKRNLGFCGGNNLGFRKRNPMSKYVVLVNSDMIVYPDSLSKIIEFMEEHRNIGSCQGIIYSLKNPKYIDTAGDYLDELLNSYQIFNGRKEVLISKPFSVTYVDGAYAIYRVESILRANNGENKIFEDEFFAYMDDNWIGLRLWNAGYKNITLPFVIAGKHLRGGSFSKMNDLLLYLYIRNRLIWSYITNSRYKPLIRLLAYKKIVSTPYAKIYKIWKLAKLASRKIARIIKPINIYRSPLILLKLNDALRLFSFRRYIFLLKTKYEQTLIKYNY